MHQMGRQGFGVLEAEFFRRFGHRHAQHGAVFRQGNAADDDALPAQCDTEVVPVIVQHPALPAEPFHTFRCAQFLQCAGHIPCHKHRRQHRRKRCAAPFVGIEITGDILPGLPRFFDQGDGRVDIFAPMVPPQLLKWLISRAQPALRAISITSRTLSTMLSPSPRM